MYKIKILDFDLAKQQGIKLEDDEKVWVNVGSGTYVDQSSATKFINPEKANEVLYPWEAIVNVSE